MPAFFPLPLNAYRGSVSSASALVPSLLAFLSVCLALDATPLCAQSNSTAGETSTWQSLFDGKSLEGWRVANFGGEGDVQVVDGTIQMAPGVSLTGVTWQGEFPKQNYEIELEAQRVQGIDFFCGLTFPVADSHCSFIVGGWAGSVVGLSNINGRDASENDTTSYMDFEKGRWYRVRVRVEEERIRCWIDDKQVVEQALEGRQVDIRPEVELSRPLGIAAWQTRAALRNVRYRRLSE